MDLADRFHIPVYAVKELQNEIKVAMFIEDCGKRNGARMTRRHIACCADKLDSWAKSKKGKKERESTVFGLGLYEMLLWGHLN